MVCPVTYVELPGRACVALLAMAGLLCAILLVFRFDSDIHGYDLGLSPLAGLLFVSQPCFGCLARIEGWGGDEWLVETLRLIAISPRWKNHALHQSLRACR